MDSDANEIAVSPAEMGAQDIEGPYYESYEKDIPILAGDS